MLEGSRIERGRKNRTNIRKKVIKEPATVAHTIRRRILFTGGSVVPSTTAAAGAREAVVPTLGADSLRATPRITGVTALPPLRPSNVNAAPLQRTVCVDPGFNHSVAAMMPRWR